MGFNLMIIIQFIWKCLLINSEKNLCFIYACEPCKFWCDKRSICKNQIVFLSHPQPIQQEEYGENDTCNSVGSHKGEVYAT